ncbi:hypothetical protein C5E45_19235 [Nocardia nova]|uniref:Core-binding (CB) domain-containing protein n=2 Tax=Nocardia nova TaxID=37330 RepID=A0A2S6AMW1_9NOCA|nr:hypothetical protein C5E45_19235 [Nocardia nova]
MCGRIDCVPAMRVERVVNPGPGEPAVRLVDGHGKVVEDVAMFLRALTVRRFSPNTVRAYAYDLLKLLRFLDGLGLTVHEFTPARAVDFLVTLRRTPSQGRGSTPGFGGHDRGGPVAVGADVQPDPGGGVVVLRVPDHL